MAQTYDSIYGFGETYVDGDTYYSAAEIMRLHKVTKSQLSGIVALTGFGVKAGFLNGLAVAAGSGLNVTVATGGAVVGTVTKPSVGINEGTPSFLMEASRDSSNPIYLHAGFYAGTGANDDTMATRALAFQPSDLATVAGWIPLAKITTSASAILTVTDIRQYVGVSTTAPTILTASATLATTTPLDISCDFASASQVITLPSVATFGPIIRASGRYLVIANVGTVAGAVAAGSGNTFGGGSTANIALAAGDTLVIDGRQRSVANSSTWVYQVI